MSCPYVNHRDGTTGYPGVHLRVPLRARHGHPPRAPHHGHPATGYQAGGRTGRYLTFSCSVLMMSVRFLPSTLSWKTHMVTSSSNWSRSSTLRPTILAMAEPQLPEPTMQTFSFCRGQGEELTHSSVCRGGRLPYSACLLATTQAQALKTSSRGRSQHSREEHDAQHSCRACERDECTVSRVASTRSCNATTADAPSGMHRGQAKNELRSALRIGTDATEEIAEHVWCT